MSGMPLPFLDISSREWGFVKNLSIHLDKYLISHKHCLLCSSDKKGDLSSTHWTEEVEAVFRNLVAPPVVSFDSNGNGFYTATAERADADAASAGGGDDAVDITIEERVAASLFCGSCRTTVSNLVELYKEYEEVRERFGQLRDQVVRQLVGNLFERRERFDLSLQECEEDMVFECWRKAVDARVVIVDNSEKIVELDLKVDLQEDVFHDEIHLPVFHPTIVEVKTETEEVDWVDEGCIEDSPATPPPDCDLIKAKTRGRGRPRSNKAKIKNVKPKTRKTDSPRPAVPLPSHLEIQGVGSRPRTSLRLKLLKQPIVLLERIDAKLPKTLAESSALSEADEVDDFAIQPECSYSDEEYVPNEAEEANDQEEDDDDYRPPKDLRKIYINPITTRKRKYNTKAMKLKAALGGDSLEVLEIRKPKYKRLSEEEKKQYTRRRKRPDPVQCPICQKFLYGHSYLRLHLRTHNGEKPCKCTECPKSFYKSSNLTAHMLTHSQERKFVCEVCGKSYQIKSQLRGHVVQAHDITANEIIYPCEFCSMKYIRISELNQHKTFCIFRPDSKKIADPVTRKPIKRPPSYFYARKKARELGLEFPSVRHTVTDPVIPVPNSDGSTTTSTHRAAAHAGPLTRYCTICETEFPTREELLSHKKTAEHDQRRKERLKGIRKAKYQASESSELEKMQSRCRDCNEVFPGRQLLINHRKKMHTENWVPCEKCGKSYSRENLNRHMKEHLGSKRTFNCQLCSRSFSVQISLDRHMRVHTGEAFLNCEYCKEGFDSRKQYRRHLWLKHRDLYLKNKPEVCTACYLNFATKAELNEHMKTHEDFKCQVCNKYFAFSQHLENHMVLHTGDRPYVCRYCGKTFAQRVNLTEHEYRHSGDRPHKCTLCNAGFLRRLELAKHIAKVHPTPTPASELDPEATRSVKEDFLQLMSL